MGRVLLFFVWKNRAIFLGVVESTFCGFCLREKNSMFQCHRSVENDVVLLVLEGKLNALTATELRETIQELVQQNDARTLLDLSGLELIDSSGVGALVSLIKRSRHNGGVIKLVGVQGQPKEIFKLLNLHQAFSIYDSKEEALSALSA
jgi:anti-sigma B factor antagonist